MMRIISTVLASVLLTTSTALGNDDVLLRAIIGGDSSAVVYVLNHGANPNATYDRGASGDSSIAGPEPALDVAIERQDARTVAVLLEHGANPNDRLSIVREGDLIGVTELMRAVMLPIQTPAERSATSAIVERLLKAGASSNVFDVQGESALSFTLSSSARADLLVPILLGYGANAQAVNQEDETYLLHYLRTHRAADPRVVADLVQIGVDPTRGDREGSTPLMAAAMHCDEGAVVALEKAGASGDAVDGKTNNALAYAMQAGCPPHLSGLLVPGGP